MQKAKFNKNRKPGKPANIAFYNICMKCDARQLSKAPIEECQTCGHRDVGKPGSGIRKVKVKTNERGQALLKLAKA